jgi:hypothetical protein
MVPRRNTLSNYWQYSHPPPSSMMMNVLRLSLPFGFPPVMYLCRKLLVVVAPFLVTAKC